MAHIAKHAIRLTSGFVVVVKVLLLELNDCCVKHLLNYRLI